MVEVASKPRNLMSQLIKFVCHKCNCGNPASAGPILPRTNSATSSLIILAASLGFEPRQRDPESLVLPLHHEAPKTIVSHLSRAAYASPVPHGSTRRGP